jgi:hypothetical protein
MFDAIADRSAAIQLARDSDDPETQDSVKGQRPAGAATMQRIRATLRKALNDAIRTHRLIEFNPPPTSSCRPGNARRPGYGPRPPCGGGRSTAPRPTLTA